MQLSCTDMRRLAWYHKLISWVYPFYILTSKKAGIGRNYLPVWEDRGFQWLWLLLKLHYPPIYQHLLNYLVNQANMIIALKQEVEWLPQ